MRAEEKEDQLFLDVKFESQNLVAGLKTFVSSGGEQRTVHSNSLDSTDKFTKVIAPSEDTQISILRITVVKSGRARPQRISKLFVKFNQFRGRFERWRGLLERRLRNGRKVA